MRISIDVPHDVLAAHAEDALDDVGPFVLNLCKVRSPLAVPQPRARELMKYAFFVSRGLEGSRERFWLHMGYFESRREAQKWLARLHPTYPRAFVTPAAVTFVAFD
jgi:hypothetical protein